MEEKKKNSKLSKIISGVIVGLLIFSLVQIVTLNDKIENLKSVNSRLNSEINQLNSNINSIYNNVDEKLKKQASLLSGVNYSVGKINDDNKTVPVSLKVVPKSLTDDMKLYVKIGDKTAELTRKDNEFSAKINIGLFIGYDEYPLLTIKSSEGIQTEYLEDVDLSYQFSNYFPTLEARLLRSSTTSNDSIHIDSTFSVDTHQYQKNPYVTFTKITLVEMLNGEEIRREDITDKVAQADGHYSEKYVKDFKISDTYDLRIYVLAENSLGYTHEALAGCWMDDEKEAMIDTVVDNEIIYDKDGNILWQKYISWN